MSVSSVEYLNPEFEEIIKAGPFPIRFPKAENLDQDEEWCEVLIDDKWQRIRFHDYAEIYKIPGMYETIFYRTLKCNSPNRVTTFFSDVLKEHYISPDNLRVLDLGAGNGMSGEALQSLGTRQIIAADIIPEAKQATMRDRPWVYNDYLIEDFTDISPVARGKLTNFKINTLLTVAALGFGDIPPKAFSSAFDFVSVGGWIVFNIKSEFLKSSHQGGFAGLINSMIQNEVIQIELYKRYQHRYDVAGTPLFYIAVVARKLRELES